LHREKTVDESEDEIGLLVDAPQKVAGTRAGDYCAHGKKGQVTGDRADMAVMEIHVPESPAKVGEWEKLGTYPDGLRKLAQWGKRTGQKHDRQEKENRNLNRLRLSAGEGGY
jgi:hypothetical protein